MKVMERPGEQAEAGGLKDAWAILVLYSASPEDRRPGSMTIDGVMSWALALFAAEPWALSVDIARCDEWAPHGRPYRQGAGLDIAKVDRSLDSYTRDRRRVLVLHGEYPGSPVPDLLRDWGSRRPHLQLKVHQWWQGPKLRAALAAADPVPWHLDWMDPHPWIRLVGIAYKRLRKWPPTIGWSRRPYNEPKDRLADDLAYIDFKQPPDDETQRLWDVAIDEVRELLDVG